MAADAFQRCGRVLYHRGCSGQGEKFRNGRKLWNWLWKSFVSLEPSGAAAFLRISWDSEWGDGREDVWKLCNARLQEEDSMSVKESDPAVCGYSYLYDG